jgi:hypothetical protein
VNRYDGDTMRWAVCVSHETLEGFVLAEFPYMYEAFNFAAELASLPGTFGEEGDNLHYVVEI